MKASWIPLLGVLTLLGFAGCSLFGYTDSDSSSQGGEVLTLTEGQSTTLNLTTATLRFVEKMNDNRCPIGVECFWEGEVEVKLAYQPNGGSASLFTMKGYVGPDGQSTVSLDTLGLTFMLERVDPYPEEGVEQTGPSTLTIRLEQ